MATEQYHEPAAELSSEIRTFARMITSLTEEAEAIGWYEQRISLEKDKQARAIMENAQKEEFKHFGMDLEFLLRRKKEWRETLKGILFTDGDIVEAAEKAEKNAKTFSRRVDTCAVQPLVLGNTRAAACRSGGEEKSSSLPRPPGWPVALGCSASGGRPSPSSDTVRRCNPASFQKLTATGIADHPQRRVSGRSSSIRSR